MIITKAHMLISREHVENNFRSLLKQMTKLIKQIQMLTPKNLLQRNDLFRPVSFRSKKLFFSFSVF